MIYHAPLASNSMERITGCIAERLADRWTIQKGMNIAGARYTTIPSPTLVSFKKTNTWSKLTAKFTKCLCDITADQC